MNESIKKPIPPWIWWVGGGVLLLGGGTAAFLIHRKSKRRQAAMTMVRGEAPPPPLGRNAPRGNIGGVQPGNFSRSSIPRGGATRTTSRIRPNWEDPFDQRLEAAAAAYVKPKTLKTLTEAEAKSLAEKIWDAKADHFFDRHDRDAVKRVFQSLSNKVEVATLSRVFYQAKKRDLWKFLDSFLDADELKTLVQHPISTLPHYQLY